jgi:hypothetical protein
MPPDLLFWSLALAATFLVGASKGGLPLVGMLAVPVMALAMPVTRAAGLLLPLYILSDAYGLWLYRQDYSRRNILIITAAATLGVALGYATAAITSDDLVTLIVGIISLLYSLMALTNLSASRPPRPAALGPGLFWGTVTGFTSFVSHAGGPPFQMYVLPQRLPKMVFAGTSTISFAYINLIKLPPYWLLGQVTVASLKTAVALAPAALFGAWAGYHLTRILPERAFYRFVETALLIVALKLIWDGRGALASLGL